MARVRTVTPKLVAHSTLRVRKDNPTQVGWRFPREDINWLKANVEGNINLVVAALVRRSIKEMKMEIAQRRDDIEIDTIDDLPARLPDDIDDL